MLRGHLRFMPVTTDTTRSEPCKTALIHPASPLPHLDQLQGLCDNHGIGLAAVRAGSSHSRRRIDIDTAHDLNIEDAAHGPGRLLPCWPAGWLHSCRADALPAACASGRGAGCRAHAANLLRQAGPRRRLRHRHHAAAGRCLAARLGCWVRTGRLR